MTGFEAIILGIIQGLTEFLPISSTGHLYLGRHLFGLDEAGLLLDTLMHIGTLLAVFVFYSKEWKSLIKKPFSKLTLLLFVGTLPAVFVGLLFKDFFDKISVSGKTIGWEFIFTGIVLFIADKRQKGKKTMEELTWVDALFIGSFQALAIFPAVSRSGLTIAAALFKGMERKSAAYFSFLLSTPAILGGIVFQGKDLLGGNAEQIAFFPLFLGTLASALFGYLAISWMINLLKKQSLNIFGYYVVFLGVSIVVLQYLKIF
ncbi:undecaprenyl-diphosphatase [Bacillus sp. AFS002410]|uniref:undecaprenyl-diphosphate phosphatase n=1 Tax=Bacillus sp. AFS002410 TaxID=2033481 RepID=UPI000BEF4278|nr:undecaprenyl-diphosphate phosphatase [Bacillus sp. AFS002410]PEJ59141.1 undecaprenyl-diphosphatase [Bacillus sp. AFS002410]